MTKKHGVRFAIGVGVIASCTVRVCGITAYLQLEDVDKADSTLSPQRNKDAKANAEKVVCVKNLSILV